MYNNPSNLSMLTEVFFFVLKTIADRRLLSGYAKISFEVPNQVGFNLCHTGCMKHVSGPEFAEKFNGVTYFPLQNVFI